MIYGKILIIVLVANFVVLSFIGLIIDSGNVFLRIISKPGIYAVCLILVYVYTWVSRNDVGRLKILPSLFILLVQCLLMFRVMRLSAVIQEGLVQERYRFTVNRTFLWQIGSNINPGEINSRVMVCSLQDKSSCFVFSYSNYLIYNPYMMCNVNGDLFYKSNSEIRFSDLYNNTILNGENISLECKDTIVSKLFEFRERLVNKVHTFIPRPQSSLLSGIIFGIDFYYSKEFSYSIKAAGISHIVAASGFNVSILTIALDKIFRRFEKRTLNLIKITGIWFYALLTGFSSSMVRASCMTTSTLISELFNLKLDVKSSFLITISVFFLFDPFSVLDLGFLLSVASTFGVIYFVDALKVLIKVKYFPFETFACTFVTLPLILIKFGTFSPYSLIANILILSFIELVMTLGVLGIIFSPILYICWGLLKYVEVVANIIAKLPYSVIEISHIQSIIASILIFIFIFLTLYYARKPNLNSS